MPATTNPWLASSPSSAAYTCGGFADGENATSGYPAPASTGGAASVECPAAVAALRPHSQLVALHAPGR